MPEIDETQLGEFQRLKALADKISQHPEGRKLMQQAVALAVPDQVGPEIRIRQEMDERFNGLQKTLTDFIETQTKHSDESASKAANERLQVQWNKGRDWAKNAGMTDEGMEKLEAFMEREGIASHRHALAAFEAENPPAPPPLTGGQHFGWKEEPKDANNAAAVKALWEGDEDTFLATILPQALAEGRGR